MFQRSFTFVLFLGLVSLTHKKYTFILTELFSKPNLVCRRSFQEDNHYALVEFFDTKQIWD